jgi:hypothetical protein
MVDIDWTELMLDDILHIDELRERVAQIKNAAQEGDLDRADAARSLLFWNFAKHYFVTHDDEYAVLLGEVL